MKYIFIFPALLFLIPLFAHADVATTTLLVTICGDALVTGSEFCDDGVNNGSYSTSTAGRICNPTCSAYGPYCGDIILQPLHGEECDDGNNTSGDNCSNLCIQESLPQTGQPASDSGGGAGGVPTGIIRVTNPTKVIVRGKAYPDSNVNILRDGVTLGVVRANGNADFYFETSGVTPGPATFGFWAEDASGLRSISFTTTFHVVESAVTTVSGVFLPPTIDISDNAVKQGEIITFNGHTAPSVTVATHVHSEEEIIASTTSSEAGAWGLDFDTTPLENESFHTAKAKFEIPGIFGSSAQSGFSQLISFYVGEGEGKLPKSPDLNGDDKVNLIDFSITLFHWGAKGGIADLNDDGNVNIVDFSILIFHWTG